MPSSRPVVLTASIDRSFLKSLFYMGDLEPFVPGAAAKTIIDDQLGAYIQSPITRSGKDYDPAVINAALETLKFPVGIGHATARSTCYCAKFFELLEAVGYDNSPSRLSTCCYKVCNRTLCAQKCSSMSSMT